MRLTESKHLSRCVHTNDPVRLFNGQCSSALTAVARFETRSILTVHPSPRLNDDARRMGWKNEQIWQKELHTINNVRKKQVLDVRKELDDVKTSYFSFPMLQCGYFMFSLFKMTYAAVTSSTIT